MTKREQIIEQTLELFIHYGLKTVRMDDIAARLGVSKRTLYELFGSREALITACIEWNRECHRKLHEEKLLAGDKRNVVEMLLDLLENWENTIQNNITLMAQLRRYYPKILEKISLDHYNEGVGKLKETLRQGVEEGVLLEGINFDFSAKVLAEAVSSTMMNPSVYENSNISPSDAFKYIIIYFFRGIATNKGRRLIDQVSARRFADRLPGAEGAEGGASQSREDQLQRGRKIYSFLNRSEKQI